MYDKISFAAHVWTKRVTILKFLKNSVIIIPLFNEKTPIQNQCHAFEILCIGFIVEHTVNNMDTEWLNSFKSLRLTSCATLQYKIYKSFGKLYASLNDIILSNYYIIITISDN